ncbi:982_t:CDS:2, partial [Entrophospora sp. SA101]
RPKANQSLRDYSTAELLAEISQRAGANNSKATSTAKASNSTPAEYLSRSMKTKSEFSINKLITPLDLPITGKIYPKNAPLSLPSPKPTKLKRSATDELKKEGKSTLSIRLNVPRKPTEPLNEQELVMRNWEVSMLKLRLSVTDLNPLSKSRILRDLPANILSLSVNRRLIKITGQIPGQPDEVYTRLPKREKRVQRAQAKLAQGQPLTRQEKELLGLIKKRPGAYKSELGRPMTPAERQRARRAKLKGGKAW